MRKDQSVCHPSRSDLSRNSCVIAGFNAGYTRQLSGCGTARSPVNVGARATESLDPSQPAAFISATRALTSRFTSAAGSGRSSGKRTVPFDVSNPASSLANAVRIAVVIG